MPSEFSVNSVAELNAAPAFGEEGQGPLHLSLDEEPRLALKARIARIAMLASPARGIPHPQTDGAGRRHLLKT